jgi:hypothetical protein
LRRGQRRIRGVAGQRGHHRTSTACL